MKTHPSSSLTLTAITALLVGGFLPVLGTTLEAAPPGGPGGQGFRQKVELKTIPDWEDYLEYRGKRSEAMKELRGQIKEASRDREKQRESIREEMGDFQKDGRRLFGLDDASGPESRGLLFRTEQAYLQHMAVHGDTPEVRQQAFDTWQKNHRMGEKLARKKQNRQPGANRW